MQTALSLMRAKQKLMWRAYWAAAVPFFEEDIGHAFSLSSEARRGVLPGIEGLSSERHEDEWLEADWATPKSYQTIMTEFIILNIVFRHSLTQMCTLLHKNIGN